MTRKGEKMLKVWLEMIIERKRIMNKLTSIYKNI